MKLSAVPTHAKERKAERPAPDSRGTFYTRTFSDLPAEAKNIREEVFVREQGFTEEFDEIDAKAVHILLFFGQKAVGTCRFFQSGGSWLIGRVAVLRAFRAKAAAKCSCSRQNRRSEITAQHPAPCMPSAAPWTFIRGAAIHPAANPSTRKDARIS